MKRTAFSVLISLCLACLGAAVTHRDLSAAVTPISARTGDFVVESGRDAGPGTLRDAILAADRLSSRARITIVAKRIALEAELPALINPHGVEIGAAAGAGTLDADRQPSGAVLRVMSPASSLHGISIVNAHETALVVNAAAVQLDGISVSDSKLGVFLGSGARGSTIRAATFERNETGITAEAGIEGVTILSTIFRSNSRAGFWFVGTAEAGSAVAERVRIVEAVFDKNGSGAVLANRPTFILKSRFIGSREFAVQVLAGTAHIEDCEVRESGGTALSVTSGTDVVVSGNVLIDNAASAVMVRDSGALVERNTLKHNGFGVVAIVSRDGPAITIRDNLVQGSAGDAITLIGGSPLVAHNQVLDNHGAGIRVLDLAALNGSRKASPRLDGNVVKGNGIDMPDPGIYKLAGAL